MEVAINWLYNATQHDTMQHNRHFSVPKLLASPGVMHLCAKGIRNGLLIIICLEKYLAWKNLVYTVFM